MAASAATTLARIGISMAGLALAACAVGQTPALQNAKPGAAVAPKAASPAANGTAPAAKPAAAGGNDAAKMAKGKQIFADYSCGSCHALSDAGADGHVGPSLDGNTALTEALVVDRVSNGQGPMPSFGGQLSHEEIEAVAHYVVHAKK